VTGSESSSASDFESLPPSAKYVYSVVDEDGPLTRQQLLEATYLAESTLDRALETLETGHWIHKSRKSDDLTQVVAQIEQSPDV
jgi:DNA-binding MarR family transcriptional regulator